MDVESLISNFTEWSGRIDLSEDSILEYLNSGQSFLDDSIDFANSPGSYVIDCAIGTSFVQLDCTIKTITDIELIEASGSFIKPTLVSLTDLKNLSTELPAFKDNGTPTFCALADARKVSIQDINASLTNKIGLIETSNSARNSAILFDCPFDKPYTLKITGKFYSPEISFNSEPSWWAVNHPFTLIHSGLFKLEINYRNSEGAKDWLSAINLVLDGVDKNEAEKISNRVSQMEG